MISVVIPILNEPRIAEFVEAVHDALEAVPHEVLLVNDGPRGAIGNALEITGPRRGKGAAVRAGVLATRGDVVVIIDADTTALLPRLSQFAELISNEGHDVVIAERDHEVKERSPLRYVLSWGLLLAQRLVIFQSTRFRDTQCGFKAYRGEVARAIAALQRVDGGMCDIEYLCAAVKNDLRIAQIAVGRLSEERPSRIRLSESLRRDPLDLLAMKWRAVRGYYRLR